MSRGAARTSPHHARFLGAPVRPCSIAWLSIHWRPSLRSIQTYPVLRGGDLLLRALSLSIFSLCLVSCRGDVLPLAPIAVLVVGIPNSGFEGGIPTVGYPTYPGQWGGDLHSFVEAENGIMPYEGRMLRFDAANQGGASAGTSCQVVQLVELSDYSDLLNRGATTAVVSAWVNRVKGDRETDTRFTVTLRAYAGSVSAFQDQHVSGNHLVSSTTEIFSNSNASWEQVTTSITIPKGSSYLAVWVNAHENIHTDDIAPEFDGHYVDNVSLTLLARSLP